MKSNREVAQLATDVLTMTLHGPLPMQTVAELAEGVIRLESENAALKAEIERLQAQVERLEADSAVTRRPVRGSSTTTVSRFNSSERGKASPCSQ